MESTSKMLLCIDEGLYTPLIVVNLAGMCNDKAISSR